MALGRWVIKSPGPKESRCTANLSVHQIVARPNAEAAVTLVGSVPVLELVARDSAALTPESKIPLLTCAPICPIIHPSRSVE